MRGTVSGLVSCIGADARDDPTDRERAIGDYTKGLEINPKFAVVCDNRARSCFKAGKAAQGLLDVEKSLELSPNSAHALIIRGSIFEALGRREEATRISVALMQLPQMIRLCSHLVRSR